MAIPSVLSIAGSDSCGGAGIQADIKTITANKLYAQTAITAITAQNTLGVDAIEVLDPEIVAAQIRSVFDDIRPDAVKIGMLGSAEVTKAVAQTLAQVGASRIVLDPVMVATSGSSLMADAALEAMREYLFPLVDILTPNLPETSVLLGRTIANERDMQQAANDIRKQLSDGAYVLIKGGHLKDSANDYLAGPGVSHCLRTSRQDTHNTHGTGCTLSSAIACNLARGYSIDQSVSRAKAYILGALSCDPHMGKGSGPLDHMWFFREQ